MTKHGTTKVKVGDVFQVPTDSFCIMPLDSVDEVSLALYIVKDTEKNGLSLLNSVDADDWTMVINVIPNMKFVIEQLLTEEEEEEESTEEVVLETEIIY